MTNIVNLYNIDNIEAWLKNDNNVYVGRPNPLINNAKWGNPHKFKKESDRPLVVKSYKEYILSNEHLASTVQELKDKVLGCWCSPKLCHAEVLHELAGNYPVYEMSHDHFTRNSSSAEKPPMSPKPTLIKPVKLNTAQLQEKLEKLELQVTQLLDESRQKDERISKMEERITQLEADELKNASYLSVQRNVSTLLSNRVSQLEQYTRRYSVIVSGVERKNGENRESLRAEIGSILQEAGSPTTITDVDKLHRNGPRRGSQQDIIVRFKSHEAKEEFYKRRKNIKREIWVKPSLSNSNYTLLKDAKEMVKSFQNCSTDYENPPEFVFANVHGDLQVKLKKETSDGTMFYQFNSMQKLYEILNKADDQAAFRQSDSDLSRYDEGHFPSHFPRWMQYMQEQLQPKKQQK